MDNKLTIEASIQDFLIQPWNIDIITSTEYIQWHIESILDLNWNQEIWEFLTRFKRNYQYYNNYRSIVFPVILSDEHSFKVLKTILSEIISILILKNDFEKYSLNIQPINLLHPEFHKVIIYFYNELKKYNIDPSIFIFEITEYTFGNQESSKKIIQGTEYLKRLGFKLAIDDIFFSEDTTVEEINMWKENLDTLLRNKIIPDYVKVDGKQLELMYINRNNIKFQLIIQKYKDEIVKIKQFGCIIIWEWIKNAEDAKFAAYLGCDLFQWQDLKPSHFKTDMNNTQIGFPA